MERTSADHFQKPICEGADNAQRMGSDKSVQLEKNTYAFFTGWLYYWCAILSCIHGMDVFPIPSIRFADRLLSPPHAIRNESCRICKTNSLAKCEVYGIGSIDRLGNHIIRSKYIFQI